MEKLYESYWNDNKHFSNKIKNLWGRDSKEIRGNRNQLKSDIPRNFVQYCIQISKNYVRLQGGDHMDERRINYIMEEGRKNDVKGIKEQL